MCMLKANQTIKSLSTHKTLTKNCAFHWTCWTLFFFIVLDKFPLLFQVVDMRWGVRDEATDDHMTTELCMKEIENCQRLSMGPNFVVFLGQKYGYRPIPTYILSSELQIIRDDLTGMGVDATLLDTWYKKDSNAVPPISVLQPISSILVNFNNKVSGRIAIAMVRLF